MQVFLIWYVLKGTICLHSSTILWREIDRKEEKSKNQKSEIRKQEARRKKSLPVYSLCSQASDRGQALQ
jgi:hypothetical protein